MSTGCDVVLVSDYDNRVPFLVQAREEVHDFHACVRVERPGWLVGEEDRRMIDKSACNGHTLTLSAGQFIRPVHYAIGKIHGGKRLLSHLVPSSGTDAAINQWQFHVMQRSCAGEQVEGLKYKPDFLIAYARKLIVVHFRYILPVEPVIAF